MPIFSHSSNKADEVVCDTVVSSLRDIYEKSLRPIENTYMFSRFHSPALDAGDFTAKPMILLLGQYSTGKTTFIKYLLGSSFPGMHIGPEPTTDKFSVVMAGEESIIPGNALVMDPQKPFRPLGRFGNNFLNRFQCCQLNNPVLDSVTIIDTPGILSGEKQRLDRGYDYSAVVHWFAQVVDRIILLFDAHKLDISDEFRRVIESLREYDNKIRIVLNKADMVDSQQLMRVYGALMWGLGKVLGTPEVVRVHIGSFWNEPLHFDMNRRLFELEERDLFKDIQSLPYNSVMRKLDDFLHRIRLVRVHAYIIGHLKKEMPSLIGKRKKQADLIHNLEDIYSQLSKQYNIPLGDFPNINKLRSTLQDVDFSTFPPLRPKMLDNLDNAVAKEIPRLMELVPREQVESLECGRGLVKGGVFDGAVTNTPFSPDADMTIHLGAHDDQWIVDRFRDEWDRFFSQNSENGVISTLAAKEYLLASRLTNNVLKQIWSLSDVDRDGRLDKDEFALANYLVKLKLEGNELPSTLPVHIVPPSKRNL